MQPGSQRTCSPSDAPAAFCQTRVWFSKLSLASSCSSICRLPAWILLTAVLAVSVNYAKVVPSSMAKHRTRDIRLVKNALLVLFLPFMYVPSFVGFSAFSGAKRFRKTAENESVFFIYVFLSPAVPSHQRTCRNESPLLFIKQKLITSPYLM